MVGIVLIQRNMRLADNFTLNKALQENQEVAVVFIGTPEQLDSKQNKYFSSNSVQFMVQSLAELDQELQKYGSRLHIYYGPYMDVLQFILQSYPDSKIYLAKDFTPYAKQRLANIQSLQVPVDVIVDDLTILDISTITTGKGTPYKTFKYFYEKVRARITNVQSKTVDPSGKLINLEANIELYTPEQLQGLYRSNPKIMVEGGRSHALKILSNSNKFSNYGDTRDIPVINTTLLSAYIKFGCVSMREVVKWSTKNFGLDSELTRQIIWHDFFCNIMDNTSAYQTVGGGNYQEKVVNWKYDNNLLEAWKQGKTGFPLADAGMRQMNTVGWMHNRVRMVVVGILCHMFMLDWHEGEKYFAQTLVDYDVSSNNGNWQATAGVGYDYRWRIFNPFSQSAQHDPGCSYIKEWVPELKDVDNNDIHTWDANHTKYPNIGYPGPLANYSQQRIMAKELL